MSLSDSLLIENLDKSYAEVSFRDCQAGLNIMDQNSTNPIGEVRFECQALQNKTLIHPTMRVRGSIIVSSTAPMTGTNGAPVAWKTSMAGIFDTCSLQNYGQNVQVCGSLLPIRNHVENYYKSSIVDSVAQEGDINFHPSSYPNYASTGTAFFPQITGASGLGGTSFLPAITGPYFNPGLAQRQLEFLPYLNISGTQTYKALIDVPLYEIFSSLNNPIWFKPRRGFNWRIRLGLNLDGSNNQLLKSLQTTSSVAGLALTKASDFQLVYQEISNPLDVEEKEEKLLDAGFEEFYSFDEHQVVTLTNQTASTFSNQQIVPSVVNPSKCYFIGVPTSAFTSNVGEVDSILHMTSFNMQFNGKNMFSNSLLESDLWEQAKRCMGSVSEKTLRGRSVLTRYDYLNNNCISCINLDHLQFLSGSLTIPMSLSFSATRVGSDITPVDVYVVLTNKIYVKLTASKNSTQIAVQSAPYVS